MDDSERVLSAWLGYWGNLSNGAMERWRIISREIAHREYSTGKLLSDTLNFWLQGTFGWYSATLGCSDTAPTIFFDLNRQSESDAISVPVALSGHSKRQPQLIWFGKVVPPNGKQGVEISPDNFKVWLSKARDELVVSLYNLRPNKKKLLEEANYHAVVELDRKPLALVYVRVSGYP
jgi:hypothetical protein